MGTLNSFRAFIYWPKSVPVKEEKGVRDKKRDRDKERAHYCPKRHANYGPSQPVSIPTLGDSFVQNYVAQIAQIAQAWVAQNPAFIRCLEQAQLYHIESKLGPESGAHFIFGETAFCRKK